MIPLVNFKQRVFAAVDRFAPLRLLRLWPALRNRCQSPAELFGEIYREKIWGGSEMDFFSGGGSHNPDVVDPYVQSVREFLASLGRPLTVVDLGCGDFNVGNRLTDLAATYIACDVVEALIERNRQLFVRNNLKFLRLDAIADPLPQGDVVIVKQVLSASAKRSNYGNPEKDETIQCLDHLRASSRDTRFYTKH